MQGPKTREQQLRILERKLELSEKQAEPRQSHAATTPRARQSEFSISRGGMNQESDHNKHNDKGQSGHKPQPLTEPQEKQR